MPIQFNTILAQANINPGDVVLLRHQDGRAKKGRTPYELWRDDRPAFEFYQSAQTFDNRSKLVRASYWASFVGTPSSDTMFAGLYRSRYAGVSMEDRQWPHADGVDPAGNCDVYDLIVDPNFADLEGKLFIEWGKGGRAWIQRAERQNKIVKELRAEFKEEAFPGYLDFSAPLSKLDSLPPGWIAALRASGGVYLLTCPKTHEQYVGKATGTEKFWQRWQDYVRTGHGGNVALKARDPSDFQVSILEVAGTGADDAKIAEMEGRWIRKLHSRVIGLNRNG